MANTPDQTNTVSRKQALHDAWVAAGSPKMNKNDKTAFVKSYKAAMAAKTQAEEALSAANEKVSELVAGLVRARGKGRLTIDGTTYVPMSRGTTCYLRAEGGGDVEDF